MLKSETQYWHLSQSETFVEQPKMALIYKIKHTRFYSKLYPGI